MHCFTHSLPDLKPSEMPSLQLYQYPVAHPPADLFKPIPFTAHKTLSYALNPRTQTPYPQTPSAKRTNAQTPHSYIQPPPNTSHSTPLHPLQNPLTKQATMSQLLTSLYTYIMTSTSRPPKTTPFRPNRVDAYPQLLASHDPASGPKPAQKPTTLLPLRTAVPNTSFLDEIAMAQSHAYYEEIDSVPAAAVGAASAFAATAHWYVIHPLLPTQVRGLSTLVLDELRRWIERSEDAYVGTARQVVEFREKRAETLGLVRRELKRRGKGEEVGENEGYLGAWEDVEEDFREDEEGKAEGKEKKLAVSWYSRD